MLRILIVDDEAIARRYLTRLVEETDGASLVAVAPDGESALASLAQTPADVAFIDIRMPGMSGLELVEQIAQSDAPPAIVFTTAHDDHALAAFELGAVDYLLKPFGANRFHVALARAARLQAGAERAQAAERAAQALRDQDAPISRLLVRTGQRIIHLPVELVERFEADNDYVVAHAAGAEHVLAVALARLAARLPDPPFCRIHRSHIINLDQLETFVRRPDGRLDARMKSGAVVTASRARSQSLRHSAI